MHFCTICDNMYYVRIDSNDEDKLIYYCRCCGNESDYIQGDGATLMCVSRLQLKKTDTSFQHIINKYTKLDPTLPRMPPDFLCTNDTCATNHGDNKVARDIIQIRYDDTNIKYVYLCSTCDTIWKM